MSSKSVGKKAKIADIFTHIGQLALKNSFDEIDKLIEQIRLQLVAKDKPVSAENLRLQAAQSLANKHPSSALSLLDKMLSEDELENRDACLTLLASVLDRLGEHERAKKACLEIVSLAEAAPERVISAANLLVRYGEDELAFEHASKAYEALDRPLSQTASVLYIAQRVAHWPSVTALTQQLKAAYAEGDYESAKESPRTNLLWCDDEKTNIAVTHAWSVKSIPKVTPLAPTPKPIEGRRIRVGYLSSDFRDHPTSRLVNGLFRHHDHSTFEIFMYCSGWDDGSEMRKEVESHMDHVHSVANLSDAQAAKLIREHGIDVLVELNGPTRANRMAILAHRPAPVQIDYLGWPGCVGGRFVDYVIGDFYTVPNGREKLYHEKVIRLSGTYQINDYQSFPPLALYKRKALGLPEDDSIPILGMFNAMNKVHEEVWAVWMQILKAVPNALLWMLNPGKEGRKHLAEACRRYGVSEKRVLAAPAMKQEAHLARLQACDLLLDPWPYGGHTSTSDALFAGVPVVTLEGRNFAGRVSGGLLKAAGLGDLIAKDKTGYVRLAVSLLKKPEQIQRIKKHIREKSIHSLTFDSKLKTREMEAAYTQALKFALAKQPFKNINFGKPPASQVELLAAFDYPESRKQPLVLVCGPWSSGTSAMAGFLAKMGLHAPGPYFAVNDPRTPETFEMVEFRALLNEFASEKTLKLTADRMTILNRLVDFAEKIRMIRMREGIDPLAPTLLKHALPAFILPELAKIFDLKIVGVLRDPKEIEATRVRRGWSESFGRVGAGVVYNSLFKYILESKTPFRLVRFSALLDEPSVVFNTLRDFVGCSSSDENKIAAINFVTRSSVNKN